MISINALNSGFPLRVKKVLKQKAIFNKKEPSVPNIQSREIE